MAEGEFPKVDGDVLYASEVNAFYFRGNFLSAEAGEEISAGDVTYIKQSDGKIYVSDTGNSDDIRVDGIASNAISSGENGVIRTGGIYTTSGLTEDNTYYLSSDGAISTTRSAVQIGHAVSSTELNIRIIQDDKDTIGTVKAYLKDFTGIPNNNLSAFWVECNGQTLSDSESPLDGQTIPDLNGSSGTESFLRGQTSSGGTGGSESHTHSVPRDGWGESPSTLSGRIVTTETGDGGGTLGKATGNNTSGSNSTLPTYYEVVWILKIK